MTIVEWGPTLTRLVADGHLTPDDVLTGRVSIASATRSNPVGLVAVDDVPRYVVKATRLAVDDVDPFVAERDCYRWLAQDLARRACAPDLIVDHDTVLVLEALTRHRALVPGDHEATLGLARVLARLHSAPLDRALLRPRRPWVLDLPDGLVPAAFAADAGVADLAATIAEDEDLAAPITELARRWEAVAPIHGDVKFDNVLVALDPLDPAPVRLIDWELAGLGLPAWDVAGIIDGHVIPALHAVAPTDALDHASTTAPAVDAYLSAVDPRVAPDATDVFVAPVARLTQSAGQLMAMGHLDPAFATFAQRVLLTARLHARRAPAAA